MSIYGRPLETNVDLAHFSAVRRRIVIFWIYDFLDMRSFS
jgi:hypothetical protein